VGIIGPVHGELLCGVPDASPASPLAVAVSGDDAGLMKQLNRGFL